MASESTAGSTTGEISPSEASCSRNRVFRRFARLKMSSSRAPMAGLPEARYPTAIEQNYAVLTWAVPNGTETETATGRRSSPAITGCGDSTMIDPRT
jgi:hypothetical protein